MPEKEVSHSQEFNRSRFGGLELSKLSKKDIAAALLKISLLTGGVAAATGPAMAQETIAVEAERTLMVTADELNVRAGASTTEAIVKTLHAGDTITVIDVEDASTDIDWVRVTSINGVPCGDGFFTAREINGSPTAEPAPLPPTQVGTEPAPGTEVPPTEEATEVAGELTVTTESGIVYHPQEILEYNEDARDWANNEVIIVEIPWGEQEIREGVLKRDNSRAIELIGHVVNLHRGGHLEGDENVWYAELKVGNDAVFVVVAAGEIDNVPISEAGELGSGEEAIITAGRASHTYYVSRETVLTWFRENANFPLVLDMDPRPFGDQFPVEFLENPQQACSDGLTPYDLADYVPACVTKMEIVQDSDTKEFSDATIGAGPGYLEIDLDGAILLGGTLNIPGSLPDWRESQPTPEAATPVEATVVIDQLELRSSPNTHTGRNIEGNLNAGDTVVYIPATSENDNSVAWGQLQSINGQPVVGEVFIQLTTPEGQQTISATT